MKIIKDNFSFLVIIVVSVFLVFSCSKLKDLSKEETKKEDTKKEETKKEETKSNKDVTTSESKLYFCEDYRNSEEINVGKRFSVGWLTVMVDLRPAGKTIGVRKVNLTLTKIKDEDGNKIADKLVATVPFTVTTDMDYIYFKDTKRLKFKAPGTYRVACEKTDGTEIVSGEVTITSN